MLGSGLWAVRANAAASQHSYQIQLKTDHTARMKLTQQLQQVKVQKAVTEQQLQQKAAHEADLQKQIDDLKRVQSKRAVPAASGYGGSFGGYGYSNPYAFGNCTWYVATHIKVPDNLGNANTWAYYARMDGFSVSSAPAVGSVAQTSAGWAGHVAIVIAVSGDQVEVREMNVVGFDRVDEAWYPTGRFTYIYF